MPPTVIETASPMSEPHRNEFGQPIGPPLPLWTARPLPPRTPMPGGFCRIEPALESGAQSRPLAVEDREPRGIAAAALVHCCLPEQPLIAEAEAQGRRPRRGVERVTFPFVAAISEFVEDPAHQ